ncbi:AMP-binding protein [Streptomyces sp. NBC_01262]|uniref:AMP-binding protein n=1 Tax=Streptomyces sp. NBC_01262 TaxID=2903803 RepID=UPI002E30C8D6|nr:AMP-binding protein [Streptomyces sp. NBC_01262]
MLSPLFSAFGAAPVEQRLRLGDARVLVTTAALYRRKVADRRASLPGLEHVLIVGPGTEELPGTALFDSLMSAASDGFDIPPTSPEHMALLHFTSGTTGTPKGAIRARGPDGVHPRRRPGDAAGQSSSALLRSDQDGGPFLRPLGGSAAPASLS